MKTFRANQNFVPEICSDTTRSLIIKNTDYEVIDTNQAFGIYVKYQVDRPDERKVFNKIYISPEEISKYGVVQNKLTVEELRRILNNITFAPSCVDFSWGWEIVEVNGIGYNNEQNPKESIKTRGFLINTTFKRPDTATGIIGIGKGRRMWIEETASETSVVMTAWICVKLIVEHELLEGFLYEKAKILNPHKTLEELAYPEKLKSKK